MKPASSALISYINTVRATGDVVLKMADVFTFTLASGVVLRYTNVDVTVTYNGNAYAANSVRVSGLKYKASIGLEVDQQQITVSALATDTIGAGASFLQALRDGSFDGALVERDRVFFSDDIGGTVIGGVTLFKGRLGKIEKIGRTSATITVNSDLVLLDHDMPRNIYQPTCLHTLYDSGCALSRSSFSTNGTVGPGSTASVINWAGAANNFRQGTLTFTSGVNDGVSVTVGSVNPGTSVMLIYPLEAVPSPGDTFTVAFGCDHTPSTCQNKFNNLVNFRGFPFVPPPQMAV